METKKCIICGDEFLPKKRRQSIQNTCSDGCNRAKEAQARFRFETKNLGKKGVHHENNQTGRTISSLSRNK